MLSKLKEVGIIILVIVITGCNNLKVNRLDPENVNAQTTKGLVYPLQFTQYTVTLTRGIANCETLKDGGDSSKTEDYYHDVKPFIKAEIKSDLVDDGDQIYVIDSESLNGITKVTNLNVIWKDGKLTGVNASADDQTGEIVSDVAVGVAKIALASIGAPVPAAGGRQLKTLACTDEVNGAIKNVVRYQGEISFASSAIENLTKKISEQEADLVKTGKKPGILCSDASNAKEIQCQLQASIADLKAKQQTLSNATNGLKVSMAKISYKHVITWPETSKEALSNTHELSDTYLSRWLEEKTKFHPKPGDVPQYQIIKDKFKNEYDTFFKLDKIGSYGKKDLTVTQTDGGVDAGIRYRLPAKGYLVVCKGTKAINKDVCDRHNTELAIASLVGPIMQFGYVFSVPFESKAFSNANFSLSFDEQGRLAEATVGQTEAPAGNAANTFKNVAEAYAEVEAAKLAKEEAEVPKTELELIQEQTELAKAQKELLDAQNALIPDVEESPSAIEEEIAVLQADTALLKARVANLKAILAFQEAEQALIGDN